jgi:CBS domain-containing membrane protein
MTRLGGFGPVMPWAAPREVARAAIGAALGLFLADVILWLMGGAGVPMMTQTALIAPFGASAFLIFAVPNSPLAQPWSAVVGNTVSALSALLVLQVGLPMVPAISAAVLLAMVAMALTRATHPPGGAVAIATVLLARPDHVPGLTFALIPVFAGTLALFLLGLVWNRATGRPYPHPPAART